ncbi:MAG: glycosyltransferase family 39 protein, partial [Proteobacteria bacterium]|nr:glycosyltransferase family 39 protein [Pseudomonadota bacterium]
VEDTPHDLQLRECMAPREKKKINKEPQRTATQIPVCSATASNTAKKQKLLLVLAVFLCALCLRLAFIYELLQQNSLLYNDLNAAPQAGFLTNDSGVYINLAKDFFSGYFGPDSSSDALLRTPGYPAFCAPFYSLGLSSAGILIAQAVLAAIIPVLTLLLAHLFTGSLLLAACTGFLSAVSPTGIGLCGLIMSDMLFAVVLIAALYCLCRGALKAQENQVLLSGLLFSAAFLVKPILAFWPVCMIAVYYFFCRAATTKLNLHKLAIAVAIQIVILGLWCTRNYVYENVFIPSSVTVGALHDFMRPRVEEWVKAGALPSNGAVRSNRDATFKKFMQQSSGLSSKEKLQALNARAMEVFKAHPLTTAKVILQNTQENMLSGWDYFPRQLPLGSVQQRNLSSAARLESVFREFSLLAVALFFLYLCVRTVFKNTDAHKKNFFAAAALGITYIYFALLAGTTCWTGSRIMYPVEFILILLLCMALQQAVHAARGIFMPAKTSSATR